MLIISPVDKMAAILQTVFSYAYSWIKSFLFCLKFYCIDLDNSLSPIWRPAIILPNADLVHRRMHAALGGDEF